MEAPVDVIKWLSVIDMMLICVSVTDVDVIKWLGVIDMMLIFVSVTDVELQEFYLASSPPPDSFLLVTYTTTNCAPLYTPTCHYIPLSLHTTIFNFTQFHTKYINLQWHFIPLNTMHQLTPLHVITFHFHFTLQCFTTHHFT